MQADAPVALDAAPLRLCDDAADFQRIEIRPSGKDVERKIAGPPERRGGNLSGDSVDILEKALFCVGSE